MIYTLLNECRILDIFPVAIEYGDESALDNSESAALAAFLAEYPGALFEYGDGEDFARCEITGAIGACVNVKIGRLDDVKARIIIGAAAAYCAVECGNKKIDILLSGGKGAPASLFETAAEWREKADRLIKNAEIAEAAAAVIGA